MKRKMKNNSTINSDGRIYKELRSQKFIKIKDFFIIYCNGIKNII